MSPFNRFWQLTFGIWVRLIKLLPKRFWQDWILYVMLCENLCLSLSPILFRSVEL